jgi:hypothetical protein
MPAPTNPDTQQQPTLPVQPPQGQPAGDPVNQPEGTQQAGAEPGAGTQPPTSGRPEGLTPEIESYLNSELAKARRAAIEEGRRKGREALQAELDDQTASEAEKLAKATTRVTTLQQELASMTKNHSKLLMALKVGLPKPEVNFKRLIDTDDEAALEQDALELKESLGVPPAGQQSPVHTPRGPSGGRTTQQPTRSEDEQARLAQVGAQATHPMYRGL